MSKIENRHLPAMSNKALSSRIKSDHVRRAVETAQELKNDALDLPPSSYRTIAIVTLSAALFGGIPFGLPGAVTGALVGAVLGIYDRAKK